MSYGSTKDHPSNNPWSQPKKEARNERNIRDHEGSEGGDIGTAKPPNVEQEPGFFWVSFRMLRVPPVLERKDKTEYPKGS